jgi:hypothetical protein
MADGKERSWKKEQRPPRHKKLDQNLQVSVENPLKTMILESHLLYLTLMQSIQCQKLIESAASFFNCVKF